MIAASVKEFMSRDVKIEACRTGTSRLFQGSVGMAAGAGAIMLENVKENVVTATTARLINRFLNSVNLFGPATTTNDDGERIKVCPKIATFQVAVVLKSGPCVQLPPSNTTVVGMQYIAGM